MGTPLETGGNRGNRCGETGATRIFIAETGATRIFIATLLARRPIEVFSTSIGGVYASSITIPARTLVCILCHG